MFIEAARSAPPFNEGTIMPIDNTPYEISVSGRALSCSGDALFKTLAGRALNEWRRHRSVHTALELVDLLIRRGEVRLLR